MKQPNSYGSSSNKITPEACELLLLTKPSIILTIQIDDKKEQLNYFDKLIDDNKEISQQAFSAY